MLQRLARDYATPVLTYGSSSYTHIDQAQKHFAELLCVCLEMAYARITLLSFDSQRIITQYVIVPLIEKNAIDKILEIILKVC
jgi:hypothetical protein